MKSVRLRYSELKHGRPLIWSPERQSLEEGLGARSNSSSYFIGSYFIGSIQGCPKRGVCLPTRSPPITRDTYFPLATAHALTRVGEARENSWKRFTRSAARQG